MTDSGLSTLSAHHLILPLASAFGYAVAALMLKRAMAFGAGPWRITFFSNLAMGIVALPLFVVPSETATTGAWYLPVITAFTFFGGQIFTFLALNRGDVSVATPLMGTKILFVALLTVFFLGQTVPVSWWIAAVIATAALGLLGGGQKKVVKGKFWSTVLYSLTSAFFFASTDVMVQEWAGDWGVMRFMPVMLGLVGLYSFSFLPFFRNSIWAIEPGGWRWIGFGGGVLGIQAVGLGVALGLFGNATAMNIAYSSRGIWSVVLIWFVGHWFTNDERLLGRGVMIRRLLGAGLLLVAVGLVALA